MWRLLFLAMFLVALPTMSRAQEEPRQEGWRTCRGDAGATAPMLYDCRPAEGAVDPQGREIWLQSVVRRPAGDAQAALYIVGVASSEVWFNGRRLGANGSPGDSAATETPGRYQIAFPIPEGLWRPADNVVVIRMSSFHGAVRLDYPVSGLVVARYPWPSRTVPLAVTFIAAGALFAAAFGFGVIHSLRRTGASLTLAALAGVAGLQAILESLRDLIPYLYPLHGWRLTGIWGLTAAFSILLVSYVASRFGPRARRPLIGLAGVATAATCLAPGFDVKTALALLVGPSLAAATAGVAVWRRVPGSRLALAYLAAFIGIGLLFPVGLIDLTYFLFAAGFLLPLLMAEVVRLGRDDQQREVALTRAAARPNCLTVASSRGVERVPLAEIIAVVGADDYVELRLTGGRRILHASRLERLERGLPDSFLRVHRSVIANLDHVRRFDLDSGRSSLKMREGDSLPVSRNRRSTVRHVLDETALSARPEAPAGRTTVGKSEGSEDHRPS